MGMVVTAEPGCCCANRFSLTSFEAISVNSAYSEVGECEPRTKFVCPVEQQAASMLRTCLQLDFSQTRSHPQLLRLEASPSVPKPLTFLPPSCQAQMPITDPTTSRSPCPFLTTVSELLWNLKQVSRLKAPKLFAACPSPLNRP